MQDRIAQALVTIVLQGQWQALQPDCCTVMPTDNAYASAVRHRAVASLHRIINESILLQ